MPTVEETNALIRLLDTDDAGQVDDIDALLRAYPVQRRVALVLCVLHGSHPTRAQRNAGELLAEWDLQEPAVRAMIETHARHSKSELVRTYARFALDRPQWGGALTGQQTARLVRLHFDEGADFAAYGRVPVEIFAPGRFNIMGQWEEYTAERIQAIIAKTQENATQYQALRLLPLKVNHDDDADNVVGWIDPHELTLSESGSVVAYPTFTEPDAAAKLQRGTYRYVSVEIYLKDYQDETTGAPLGEAFRDVAIVPHPRHRSIRGFVFAEELGSEPDSGEPAPDDPAEQEVEPASGPTPPTDPPSEGDQQRGDSMFEEFLAKLKELLGREPTQEDLNQALTSFSGDGQDPLEPEADAFAELPTAVAEHFRAELAKRDQTIQSLQATTERERRQAFMDRLNARIERSTAGPLPELTPHQGDLIRAIASAGPGNDVQFGESKLDWVSALFELAKLPDAIRHLMGEAGIHAMNPYGNVSLMEMGRKAGESAIRRTNSTGVK